MATESSDMPPRLSVPEVILPSPLIDKLGDDLLIEILIRLPNPRSACRSKAVCKQWRSLISDPCFSRRFLSHHQSKNKPPPPKLLLSAGSLTFLPMPPHGREDFAIFDCFKDLLLCGFGETGNRHTNAELARSYLLCNPFTKQWIALPLAPEGPLGLTGLCARLVCEPLVSNSLELGGGYDYEHRFRVVCIYQDGDSMKLDVFCSESGEWTKEALALQSCHRRQLNDVVSCNGVLYVPCARVQDLDAGLYKPLIAGFDPFRLNVPPAPIDVSPTGPKCSGVFSVSQGALHLSLYERVRPFMFLSIWRLDEECKLWRNVCESPLKSSSGDNYRFTFLGLPALHPEKPEIAFFFNIGGSVGRNHVSCDLGKGGELEVVCKLTQDFLGWRVFQPKVYCWPTPIPRYRKLRVMYDGSYSCWVQSN